LGISIEVNPVQPENEFLLIVLTELEILTEISPAHSLKARSLILVTLSVSVRVRFSNPLIPNKAAMSLGTVVPPKVKLVMGQPSNESPKDGDGMASLL